MNLKDPKGRLARWALQIQPHNFDIVYRPGRVHSNADGIFRRPTIHLIFDESFSPENIKEKQNQDSNLHFLIKYLQNEIVEENDPNPTKTICIAENYLFR